MKSQVKVLKIILKIKTLKKLIIKYLFLDDIKSYKLTELQNLAKNKKLSIMKKGKTKDVNKTKLELYNELKGLFK